MEKPPGSSMFITGFQYPPVLSMATWVTPKANSHSFSSVKDLVVDWNVRVYARSADGCHYLLLVDIEPASALNDFLEGNLLCLFLSRHKGMY